MPTSRRQLLGLTAGLAALAAGARAAGKPRIQAVAFDGFPIIDPRPVAARAEALFPGKGDALMAAWRARQFEYTWLRTLAGRYADFWQVTDEALRFAARSSKLELDGARREQLMGSYLELGVWPDVPPVLEALRTAGVRLAFLSNFTARMLDAPLARAGLAKHFEPHLTTDRVKAFKPDPRAYQMALDAFRLPREAIAFVASAGWDAAGARWFGYPTVWVNRQGLPAEELGVAADVTAAGLPPLLDVVR